MKSTLSVLLLLCGLTTASLLIIFYHGSYSLKHTCAVYWQFSSGNACTGVLLAKIFVALKWIRLLQHFSFARPRPNRIFDFWLQVLGRMSGDRSLSRKPSALNLKEKVVKYYEAIFQVLKGFFLWRWHCIHSPVSEGEISVYVVVQLE